MPFQSPFNFPYFFRPNYRHSYSLPYTKNKSHENVSFSPKETKTEDSNSKHNNCSEESSDYFFEIFGLKLYFDDILIMCLLFFLYTEGIQDQELFLCLILLLLS